MDDEMKDLVETVVAGGEYEAKRALSKLKYKVITEDEFFEEVEPLCLGVEYAKKIVEAYLAGVIEFESGLHVEKLFNTNNIYLINAALAWNGRGNQWLYGRVVEELLYKLKIKKDIRRECTRWLVNHEKFPQISDAIFIPFHQKVYAYIEDNFTSDITPFLNLVENHLSVEKALKSYLSELTDYSELLLHKSPGTVLDEMSEELVKEEIIMFLQDGMEIDDAVISVAANVKEFELRDIFAECKDKVAFALAGRYLTEEMGVLGCDLTQLEVIAHSIEFDTTEELAQSMLCEYAYSHETNLDNHLSFVSEEKKEEFLELFREYKQELEEEFER